jgi:ABC transporter substrate binding protein (PQQ-dependent alcohol dehydrogenase system)
MTGSLALLGQLAVALIAAVIGCGMAHADAARLTLYYVARDGDPAYAEERLYTGLKLRERKPPLPGAQAAIKEARILGRAAGLEFDLEQVTLPEGGDAVAALQTLRAEHGPLVVIADLPFDDVARAGRALAEDAGTVIFNIRDTEDSLRAELCSPVLFHTVPSDAMLSDALAQHMLTYRWNRILVLASDRADDARVAKAFVASAGKFGLRIADEREFTDSNDPRKREMNDLPLLTGGVDYDAIFLADSVGEFGRYLEYATYLPRPVAGAEGLTADAWHWTWERNGAPQLNQRIRKISGRDPSPEDWAAWVAVRSAVQAAVDTGSTDPARIRARLRDPAFSVDMYKIGAGSFRAWDNQLRQPILLHTHNGVVSVAPLDGFLHRFNTFDSLGVDAPETACHFPTPN